KVGNKPGVTKGNQWIRLNEKVELLDTPGLLWPKFEDQTVGSNLAFIGSINDEILSRYDLSISLVERLKAYPGKINERYGVDESVPSADIIKAIGQAKLLLKKGGEVDEEKACRMLIDDFRSGKLGRISLESPDKGDSNVSEETGV
ncbi:MAG: ribosome biogenesis GTPase YlqF, partial [Lachnospiraceae bacterium]|nr:ribosome biogenesis GTPase YlqF [Lachnospiraceae bacterium]